MKENSIKVSYGQTADEYIEINSLSDEARFAICLKLYKTHPTMESLEKVISDEGLLMIKDII